MTDASRNGSRAFIERFGVSLGTLAIILAQTVAVTGWLANDHAQIVHLSEYNARQDQKLDYIDANGSHVSNLKFQGIDAYIISNARQMELLQNRAEEARDNRAKLQAEIDLLKQEDNRIEEQQTRILQALDNTYNLLQEHLRAHSGNAEKGPSDLRLSNPRPPK